LQALCQQSQSLAQSCPIISIKPIRHGTGSNGFGLHGQSSTASVHSSHISGHYFQGSPLFRDIVHPLPFLQTLLHPTHLKTQQEVAVILEFILRGLLEWIYGLSLEITEFIVRGLLGVFSMDLVYFEATFPITSDIQTVIIGAGWALLLGNLVFQAAKSMMSGLGFEAEDPKTLFARTFVFAFCLLASRQIINIGLSMTSTIITMLQIPDSIVVSFPDEGFFDLGASWLLLIIVGFVIMWQLIRLFFAIGERYFLVGLLAALAPFAFATGGSRNTSDIFKGWLRMFASMCLMMVLNVIFLRMFLSAMGNMPSGYGAIPWLIIVVAITRTARKMDDFIMRIGLNPAHAGGQGRGLPGMLSLLVIKGISSSVLKSTGGAAATAKTPQSAASRQATATNSQATNSNGHSTNAGSGWFNRNSTHNHNSSQNAATQNSQNSSTQKTAANVPGANQRNSASTSSQQNPGMAGTASTTNTSSASTTNSSSITSTGGSTASTSTSKVAHGAAGTATNSNTATTQSQSSTHTIGSNASSDNHTSHNSGRGHGAKNTLGKGPSSANISRTSNQQSTSRRSSATQQNSTATSVFKTGAAGNPAAPHSAPTQGASPAHPPIPRSGQSARAPDSTAPGTVNPPRPARYSSVPSNARSSPLKSDNPGTAGTSNASSNRTNIHQGGSQFANYPKQHTSSNATTNAKFSGVAETEERRNSAPGDNPAKPSTPDVAGIGTRQQQTQHGKPGDRPVASGTNSIHTSTQNSTRMHQPKSTLSPANAPSVQTAPSAPGAAGTESRRRTATSSSTANPVSSISPRGSRNMPKSTHNYPKSAEAPKPAQKQTSQQTFNQSATPVVKSAAKPNHSTGRITNSAADSGKKPVTHITRPPIDGRATRITGISNIQKISRKSKKKGKGVQNE